MAYSIWFLLGAGWGYRLTLPSFVVGVEVTHEGGDGTVIWEGRGGEGRGGEGRGGEGRGGEGKEGRGGERKEGVGWSGGEVEGHSYFSSISLLLDLLCHASNSPEMKKSINFI